MVVGPPIGVAAAKLDENHRWIVVAVGGVVLAIALVTLFALEQLKTTALSIANTKTRVQVIPSRTDFYRYAVRLIGSSREIRDTTWGRSAPDPNRAELAARLEYREEVARALRSDKVYRELFSIPKDMPRLIKEVEENKKQFPKYKPRLVQTDLSTFSVVDFLIGDGSKVLFSHVDARDQVPMFLYVESEDIAQLFLRVFQECWSGAKEL
jgi:hypothetical protein